jgi:PAS domain S-box-containing protein
MNHSPAIAWVKDAALRYTYVSEPFLSKLDKKPAELLGRGDLEVWTGHPGAREAAAKTRENDLRVQRSGVPLQAIESGGPRPDGGARHWLSTKFPLPDATGAIGVAGTAIDITERFEAETAARQHSEEVRALLDRLMSAQELERQRLATELHDLIGQNLTALGIWLSNLANSLSAREGLQITAQVAGMRRTVEQTVEAIRGVMSDLRPPALDEYGLLPALRTYASEFQAQTSLRTLVDATGTLTRLPARIEVTLFRIVQEALTNAVKHSDATLVRILIEQSARLVCLSVEDDGRGFTEPVGARKSRRGGWGLPVIRERAEACGGAMRIEHRARGTRLVVEVPVPDAH